jgi:hypothetical protein
MNRASALIDYEGLAMNKYIREGGMSFHESKGRYINPYKVGSTQFNDFERGWTQALKRSPKQLLRNHGAAKKTPRRQRTVLPKLTPVIKKKEMPEDTYVLLARRAREKLLNDPSYQPPNYGWRTKVYYARIEANEMPLWKIGITSNNLDSRYCIADRQIIVEIKSWQYATREEAEAIEREVLAEFADDVYDGGPVLRSGGDSELFTRDVLKLDSQDDFLAMVRRKKQAPSRG